MRGKNTGLIPSDSCFSRKIVRSVSRARESRAKYAEALPEGFRMEACGVLFETALKLSASAHSTTTEKKPVQRHVFFCGECEEEVRMGRCAILVAIHVLLEYSEFTRKLSLGPFASDLRNSLREFLLQSSYRCPAHDGFPSALGFHVRTRGRRYCSEEGPIAD